MTYTPAADRYSKMVYRRCGKSGLKLPAISLGLWHNFGHDTPHQVKRDICRTAFDLGITHFDLANNYGPPPGSAEATFAQILHTDLAAHRDELIITSKAGHDMWSGPYGQAGSLELFGPSRGLPPVIGARLTTPRYAPRRKMPC